MKLAFTYFLSKVIIGANKSNELQSVLVTGVVSGGQATD